MEQKYEIIQSGNVTLRMPIRTPEQQKEHQKRMNALAVRIWNMWSDEQREQYLEWKRQGDRDVHHDEILRSDKSDFQLSFGILPNDA